MQILKLLGLLFLFLLVVASCTENENNTNTTAPVPAKPAGYVNKSTFQGKWALTKDEAELKCVNLGGGLTGTTVKLDEQTYALTRNINNVEFLPLHYWLDAPTEDIGTFKNVCSDVMLDSKTCKVSVSDMVQYADKLCK